MALNPNLTIRYAEVDLDYEAVLAGTPPDEDGPVWMVNLMKYRPVAEYADGRATRLTGAEADDTYAPFEAFAEVGADLVFLADVEMQLLGDQPQWDRVAVVRYPTRRAFVDMTHHPSFEAKHPHKDAGMERTATVRSCSAPRRCGRPRPGGGPGRPSRRGGGRHLRLGAPAPHRSPAGIVRALSSRGAQAGTNSPLRTS